MRVKMRFAHRLLGRHPSGLSAYNDLQFRVMRRYLRSGGTLEQWCARIAPAFRARYGWMLGELATERASAVRQRAA